MSTKKRYPTCVAGSFLVLFFFNLLYPDSFSKLIAHVKPVEVIAISTKNPVLVNSTLNPVARMQIKLPEGSGKFQLRSVDGILEASSIKSVGRIEVYSSGPDSTAKSLSLLGSANVKGERFSVKTDTTLVSGTQYLWLNIIPRSNADITTLVDLKLKEIFDFRGERYPVKTVRPIRARLGITLRKPNDNGVKAYRIPGMITTNTGMLVTVYDIRHQHSGDLPADIDVGMSRSFDGGRSWSDMKVIMDMGEPHADNGIGDPSILFDNVQNTIWVTALWSKGNRSIRGSKPGLTPDETGQFVMTYSKDNGKSWAKPYSITPQVKDPKWHIFFPGPGNGITMHEGKLVFPAQYWDEHHIPYSTLIYSNDHGLNWKRANGAKSNTTESQLVELTSGKIMLNMRDNRGGFRSVATSSNMGKTWEEHSTSYNTLIDPVCMASIIKAKVYVKGKLTDVLFFSNPSVKSGSRKNITIKASLDQGETWQPDDQLLIDDRDGFGYSSLTKIDENNVGILYEGFGSLNFVRVPVKDIIK